MRVLGIDPGTVRMGYGVLEQVDNVISVREWGVLEAPSRLPMEKRLVKLYAGLLALIDHSQPDQAAIEEPFVHSNVRSAMMIGEAKAVAILAVAGRGLPVFHYAPRQVKQAVTGHGGSDKEQVQEMVRLQLGMADPPTPLDASDAIAVALCHLQRVSAEKVLTRDGEITG